MVDTMHIVEIIILPLTGKVAVDLDECESRVGR